uniref:Mitochondrial carrier protein n=1 Tax=Aureoumbra lagunensis TaxID=44058 RepID=A0A7S3JP69_9STRA|mmetsp:Transcript_6928/g.9701  ORF Transcript_6928/g.9701 Transcript_6928/m.9701 type:complete len:357 (-) Transcript_6928:351-1421(-)|eukprot:CAMPEP_0197292930 /NCGR_PEP_ID=MMETSP0890-20130614/25930_1 /TAXON_ID=44058 ORGANISM="Aureoumbra lagunensis, Strain CCMP1510" /NCGR_SAMPLE_ID=MMETSP0890 /ASSEMBLY_ACC=CAM_ASM_000533 /LENGTH=356 /DNA_ID=CAMNT_0042767259 /DNA_START=18 /DNA_END=1088 /DNA_ORIENTATION=-
MNTGDDDTSKYHNHTLSDSQITWVSGTAAGLAATYAKQPIQRIKWIQQTSVGNVGLWSIGKETIALHGWRGFFAGSVAAIFRNVPHSVLVYSMYPHFARISSHISGPSSKQQHQDEHHEKESFLTRFLAGYVTMIAATVVTHPLDTLRVRLSVAKTHESIASCALFIYRMDGALGFYSGFSATLLGAGPRGAVGFAVFESAKPRVAAFFEHKRPGISKFLCGYVAGVLAETLVYPLDTVRRRQQALGVASPLFGAPTHRAIMLIVQNEGFSGLFKGIALNLVKNPAAVAVSFLINDLVKETLGYGNRRKTSTPTQEPASILVDGKKVSSCEKTESPTYSSSSEGKRGRGATGFFGG